MSFLTEEGRREAAKDFYDKLKNDPRYEVIGGELKLKPETTIEIIESNLKFYMNILDGDISEREYIVFTPAKAKRRLVEGYITLINVMTMKIKRDHCE